MEPLTGPMTESHQNLIFSPLGEHLSTCMTSSSLQINSLFYSCTFQTTTTASYPIVSPCWRTLPLEHSTPLVTFNPLLFLLHSSKLPSCPAKFQLRHQVSPRTCPAAMTTYHRVSLSDTPPTADRGFELQTLHLPAQPTGYTGYSPLPATFAEAESGGNPPPKRTRTSHFRSFFKLGGTTTTPSTWLVSAKANSAEIGGWVARRSLLRHSGWAFTLRLVLYLSSVVSVVNLVCLFVAASYPRLKEYPSISIVRRGECEDIKAERIWASVGLNLVVTVVVGCGAYCMQVVCGPSRPELEAAHKKGGDVRIGGIAVGNLRRVGWGKGLMFVGFGGVVALAGLM